MSAFKRGGTKMAQQKLVCYSQGGAEATLTRFADDDMVGGGAKRMSSYEAEQYRRARLMAAPANGGDLTVAKTFLEAHEWTCYWDGPPPKDSRFELRLSAEEKAWVLGNGGAEMVRTLIRAARERQEAQTPSE